MNRNEFFDRLAALDEGALKTVLWTVYWRGGAPTRERIEAELDPQVKETRQRTKAEIPDSGHVLVEVSDFCRLARAGAYLAGDRRVSPKERTRWRFTFRRLADDAVRALSGADVESAATAVARLVDLACEMRDVDYFRSEDPVEAARFVVSDAVAVLWGRVRETYGFSGLAERAAHQLLRWESRHGWTRRADGWVREHETSLAQVLAPLVPAPELWTELADEYLLALDRLGGGGGGRRARGRSRSVRAEDLGDWHRMLVERLLGSDDENRIDRLLRHPALSGPARTELRAVVAGERGA